MPSRTEEILTKLQSLLREGANLLDKDKPRPDLVIEYESWFTKAYSAVKAVAPARADDFMSAYKLKSRKAVTYDTYTISDYLIDLVITRFGKETFDTDQAYQAKLLTQLAILKAAIALAPSVLRDIRTVLQTELFDGDLDAARELAKKKYLRSSGVVCGVVLERHLKSVCDSHGIKFRKKHLAISDLNDALKNQEVYDVPMWRFIQRLGDIRNLCGHSKDRDPAPDEVEDLISGTDKVMKEVF